jgi:hypothetical protein
VATAVKILLYRMRYADNDGLKSFIVPGEPHDPHQ